jgi:tetratricopeptide (TPR) repeat protein
MRKLILASLILSAIVWSPGLCWASRDLTPQESKYVKDVNQILVLEIQKGLDDIKQGNVADAFRRFLEAIKIAPNDPMAYQLLVRALIHSDQENLAYQILEKAGRNNTDNNLIIQELYTNIESVYGFQKPPAALPLISIAQFKNNKDCAISFIFDDGEPSVATAILPMFEEYGWRTTIAINPGMIPPTETDPYRAGWGAWRKAAHAGHEIANHGLHHRALPGLSAEQLQEEVEESRTEIIKNLAVEPRSFVFPEDKTDPDSIRLTLQNHIAARDHETLQKLYDRILIPVFGGKYFSSGSGLSLIKIAMTRKLWLIPECHGLLTPYVKNSFKSISPELLRDQLEFMNANSDRIWVSPFISVFCYLTERQATEIKTIRSSDHHIEFELANHLDAKLYFNRLTVLINPAQPPHKVQAMLKATKAWIPTSTHDGLIVINIMPNLGPIDVDWE